VTTIQPKSGILDISPYVGGQSTIDGTAQVIKLASNEGALGPSPKAVEACSLAAKSLHRYPDGACAELRAALAHMYKLDGARIVCGAGSDELLDLLARAYAGPGDEVMFTEHGFLMYPIAAKGVGATPVSVAEKNLTAHVDGLLERATDKTKIVFLANPNNPTGTYLPDTEVRRLRDGLPDGALLVIDAAYAEYVVREDYQSGIQLVEDYDNVVMTRTFSKIHALGGVRLGWAYCPAAIADVLNRLRGPFNVSAPAQAAGLAALADEEFTEQVREHTLAWHDWLKGKLIGLGLEVPSEVGNFVLVRFPSPQAGDTDFSNGGRTAEAADGFLKSRAIIVRRMDSYGLPDCLRITIGTEKEMRAVFNALAEFLG